jgi:hypothetical protein
MSGPPPRRVIVPGQPKTSLKALLTESWPIFIGVFFFIFIACLITWCMLSSHSALRTYKTNQSCFFNFCELAPVLSLQSRTASEGAISKTISNMSVYMAQRLDVLESSLKQLQQQNVLETKAMESVVGKIDTLLSSIESYAHDGDSSGECSSA